MANNICLQCKKKPKRAKYQFCSRKCTKNAANKAPSFLKIPKNHIMYRDVTGKFNKNWKGRGRPKIKGVYLVTWSAKMRQLFDTYRAKIERKGKFAGRKNKKGLKMSSGNEKKLFRGTRRACSFGDNNNMKPCKRPKCQLCIGLRCGFGPHLREKRKSKSTVGVRLGAGIYCSKTSSKAYQYAVNIGKNKRVRIVMSCRTVVGRPFDTSKNHNYKKPPNGYDSVYGKPRTKAFPDDEYVVYDENAIRIAYILVLG